MTDLHAVLLAAITARQERAQAAAEGWPTNWEAYAHEPGARDRDPEREVWLVGAEELDTMNGKLICEVGQHDRAELIARLIAAEDPAAVLRQCTEDLAILDQHPHGHNIVTGAHVCVGCLDPSPCGWVLSLARRYGIDTNGDQA